MGYGAAAMPDDFGRLLADLIDDAKITRSDFAVKAGISASFVSNLVYGDRTPPIEQLDRYADVLGLNGEARERFLQAGRQARAMGKTDTRGEVEQVYHRLNKLDDALRDITAAVSQFESELPERFLQLVEAVFNRFEQ